MPLTRSADGRPPAGDPGVPPPSHAAPRRSSASHLSLLKVALSIALTLAVVVAGLLLPGGVLVFALATITCVAALAHGALSDPGSAAPRRSDAAGSETLRSFARTVRHHLDL